MNAFRLYAYRVFCGSCNSSLDVQAIDEQDAGREAIKAGWVSDHAFGAVCIKCWDLLRHNKYPLNKSLPGEQDHGNSSTDQPRHASAASNH